MRLEGVLELRFCAANAISPSWRWFFKVTDGSLVGEYLLGRVLEFVLGSDGIEGIDPCLEKQRPMTQKRKMAVLLSTEGAGDCAGWLPQEGDGGEEKYLKFSAYVRCRFRVRTFVNAFASLEGRKKSVCINEVQSDH